MIIRRLRKAKEWGLLVLFYILLLQDPISVKFVSLKYIDEAIALLGPVFFLYRTLKTHRIILRRENLKIACLLSLFCFAGLAGNLIYDYQITKAILIDLFANIKFFATMLFGYEVYLIFKRENCSQIFLEQARFSTLMLFILTILDSVLEWYPSGDIRYGIQSLKLFYYHPTYLAGSLTFLIAIMILYFEKKNKSYLLMANIMLFLTMRGKAMATVAIFYLVFFFLIYKRRKLRIWHIILVGLAAIIIAWDQFSYYYIDLDGVSARSALTQKAFLVARDHFPFGTGFGTYGSSAASVYYSQVYRDYGLSSIHGLTEGNTGFGSDTFWPVILGQNGVVGLMVYVVLLYMLFLQILRMRHIAPFAYAAGVFMFGYFAVSSTSEPTFFNVVSMPLALLLGFISAMEQQERQRRKEILDATQQC